MPYKIRVTKKKETAPLRIVNRSEEMLDQVRTHPQWIWMAAGAIVAILIALVAFQFVKQNAESKASAIEAEASTLFHEPPPLPQPIEEGKEAPKEMSKTDRLKKSASLYDEIVEKYPRTATAMVAQYESGNVYFELGDTDAAEKRYRAFLEKYSERKDLTALVHIKMGYLNQKKGDASAAMAQFKAAYDMNDGKSRGQAGFELGRALEQAGKKEEAIEIYKKLAETQSQSPWAAEANARMVSLNPPAAAAPPADAGKPAITPPVLSGEKPAPAPKPQKK